jgi:hypothetical protein
VSKLKFKRCEYGHYYDPSKYESCPHCFARSNGVEAEYTVAKAPIDEQVLEAYDLTYGDDAPVEAPSRRRRARPEPPAAPAPSPQPAAEEESVTVARVEQRTGVNPPVGWLVQTAGPNKGQAYVIHSERNTLGRSSSMDICIKGDVGISRDTNAVLSYNPRNRDFHLVPGEGKAIIYLNDQELLDPALLHPYDRIEISDTALLFLPLCGDRFSWEEL